MLDISEKLGREACAELQSEYSKDSVMFIHCDVTNREQLVSLMASSTEKLVVTCRAVQILSLLFYILCLIDSYMRIPVNAKQ